MVTACNERSARAKHNLFEPLFITWELGNRIPDCICACCAVLGHSWDCEIFVPDILGIAYTALVLLVEGYHRHHRMQAAHKQPHLFYSRRHGHHVGCHAEHLICTWQIVLHKRFGNMIEDTVKAVLPGPTSQIMIDIDIDDNMYATANGIITHNSKYPLQAVSL